MQSIEGLQPRLEPKMCWEAFKMMLQRDAQCGMFISKQNL